jgi:ABC-2 type transport system permease protein
MMYPLVFLFLIVIFSSGKFLAFGVVGGFIAIVAENSLFSSSDAAFQRIELKFQDLLVTTRISHLDYILAMGLSFLAPSLPGIAVYAVIGAIIHIFTLASAALFAAILVLVLLSTLSIAFMIASFAKHTRNIWGISSIMVVLLTMVPPTFYPYTILPKAVLYLFMLSPVTLAAIASQGAFGLTPQLSYAIPLLVAETIIYFAIAMKLTKWREN